MRPSITPQGRPVSPDQEAGSEGEAKGSACVERAKRLFDPNYSDDEESLSNDLAMEDYFNRPLPPPPTKRISKPATPQRDRHGLLPGDFFSPEDLGLTDQALLPGAPHFHGHFEEATDRQARGPTQTLFGRDSETTYPLCNLGCRRREAAERPGTRWLYPFSAQVYPRCHGVQRPIARSKKLYHPQG